MSELPKSYEDAKQHYPTVMSHYEALGQAVQGAGPLEAKTAALIRLGMCIGAGLEGGAHASVRKAREAGCTAEELRHAALLAVTTLGFPSMARSRTWVEDLLSKPV